MSIVRLLFLVVAMVVSETAAFQSSGFAQTTSHKGAKAAEPAGDLIDLNTATQAQLKTLPGVGEAYSLAIIKHRPYKNKTQLKSRNVIPPAAYEKIKNKVIAKQ